MADPYPLRPVTDAEFAGWARMIADTYGADRTDAEIADQRAATALDRTVGAFDGGTPVGGLSLYRRLLTVPGDIAVPTAGVASVGVAPTHRRRGILMAMTRRQLTDLYENGREAVAALRPAEAGIYGRYGYGPASRGVHLRFDRRAMGFRPGTGFGTGTVSLLDRSQARPLVEAVYDQARTARAGWPDRAACHWDVRLRDAPHTRPGATSLRFALHREDDGRTTGYALYRHLQGDGRSVRVEELAALTGAAYAALWRFLAGIDLAAWITYEGSPDEPLAHLLADPRPAGSTTVDRLWVRPVDVGRALAARRYAVPVDLVLDVRDDFCPWNTGRHRLQGDTAGAVCAPTRASADLVLGPAELGAAYLGGTTLASLAAAGRVEEQRPGALAAATAAFRGDREPFYPGGWAFPLY